MTSLKINNVSKVINDASEQTTILKPTSVEINDQDFVVVLGTNGAGKSTFFNLITGDLMPTTGSIYLNEHKLTTQKRERRAKYISQVFQDPKLGTAPRMTVAENLLLAERRGLSRRLFPRKLKTRIAYFKDIVADLPNDIGLKLNTATEKLSGGQRQTLSFLMSIIKKPDLLLLDEHTSALDPQTSNSLMKFADATIKEKKITCLMITHDLETALNYGNRILIFNNGQIVSDIDKNKQPNLTKDDLLKYFD
ncbi:ATP-binding cassette domain-containing protein [Lactobacillus sp. YT155]|uniref:ABC transporter ATP-binding protein n=1 Tax=Lactobacillus sp. YT155 TaxID=3060955 RepID=UPI00265E6B62|nr:ATP-binding cassette domain-containing protein [Lactobacillus sp. YT155]MDO1605172.1 ATP-binding cassette domain-containing protein [Lactobacillus sp. YT155]